VALLAATCIQCRLHVAPGPGQIEEVRRWEAAGADPKAAAESVAASLSTTADPCQDFFDYACGGWIASKTKGRTWARLQEETTLQRWDVIQAIAGSQASDPGSTRLRDLQASCTDRDAIRRAGRTAIDPLLAQITAVDTPRALMATVGALHRVGVPALFELEVQPDPKDPSRYAPELVPAGLSLGFSELYQQQTPLAQTMRSGLRTVLRGVESVTELEDDPGAVVHFETELAAIQGPRAALMNPASWSTVDLARLEALAPLPWDTYFRAVGLSDDVRVTAAPAAYFQGLAGLLHRADFATVRAYLAWRLEATTGPRISNPLWESWTSCVAASDAVLPDVVARAYAERYLDAEQQQARQIWKQVRTAFAHRLEGATWLPDPSRTFALRKIAEIEPVIGYAMPPMDYSSLTLARDQFLQDLLAGRHFQFDEQLRLISTPVDRRQSFLSPFTLSAGYQPQLNQVVIPLGLLQPPLFGSALPAAVNFGGLGFLMAHEMAHALDSGGRRFGERGGAAAPQDAASQNTLAERESCMERVFAGEEAAPEMYFSPSASSLPALAVDTVRTRNENIADLSGVEVAFDAFTRWTNAQPNEGTPVAGLTNDQLFFVAFAQVWCAPPNDFGLQFLALVDEHAPMKTRVNAVLSQVPQFGDAFHCPAGTPMQTQHPCKVW